MYSTAIAVLSLLAESRFAQDQAITTAGAEAVITELRRRLKRKEEPDALMLDQVLAAADASLGLRPPRAPVRAAVPPHATGEERGWLEAEAEREHEQALSDHQKAIRAFATKRKKIRASALKALLSAFAARRVRDAEEGNVFEPVNLVAARALGLTGHTKASAAMRRGFAKSFLGSRFEVPPIQYEETFTALARLGDPASLKWLATKVVGSKASTACDAPRAGSALRAMRGFTQAPGKTRHQVFAKLLETYAPLEDRCDSEILDEVRATLRHLMGPAPDAPAADTTALAEYAAWLTRHEDPAAPPWADG